MKKSLRNWKCLIQYIVAYLDYMSKENSRSSLVIQTRKEKIKEQKLLKKPTRRECKTGLKNIVQATVRDYCNLYEVLNLA